LRQARYLNDVATNLDAIARIRIRRLSGINTGPVAIASFDRTARMPVATPSHLELSIPPV
jgi:hypothetical protein